MVGVSVMVGVVEIEGVIVGVRLAGTVGEGVMKW